MATPDRVDAAPPAARDVAMRIGLAWREIRRGASTGPLREFLYSTDAIAVSLDAEQIELGQVDTLDLLVQRPTWRMSELAEALRVEPSTATRAVQRLEKSGLAARQPSSDDGRGVTVHVTADGQTVHAAIAARRTELFTYLLTSFEPAELPVLADLLERFVTAVDDFVADHRR
ncbi:MAG: MarR family winged helix-turn-helix transcriptional regulator [Ilumatobacteraceae bacterium]